MTANVSRPRKIYDKATLILIHDGLSSRKRGQTHILKKIFSSIYRDFSTILQIVLKIFYVVSKNTYIRIHNIFYKIEELQIVKT